MTRRDFGFGKRGGGGVPTSNIIMPFWLLVPEESDDPDVLIRQANEFMADAKAAAEGRVVFPFKWAFVRVAPGHGAPESAKNAVFGTMKVEEHAARGVGSFEQGFRELFAVTNMARMLRGVKPVEWALGSEPKRKDFYV